MNNQNNHELINDLCKDKLSVFAKTLHRSIVDFEREQRKLRNDPYFDGYEELGFRINCHPQTLRKMTNQFNPEIPNYFRLLQICTAIDDNRPFDCAVDLGKEYLGVK